MTEQRIENTPRFHSARPRRARSALALLGATLLLGVAGCADIHADAVTGLRQVVDEFDDTPSNDLLLADRGYKALGEGNLRDAELYLGTALQANPSNPYALLNMGVVYERTGRTEQAREMYRRLIAINPPEVAKTATQDGMVGLGLADIARQNLQALDARTARPEAEPRPATGAARLEILQELLDAGLVTPGEYAARAPSAESARMPADEELPAPREVARRLTSLQIFLETDVITARIYDSERAAILDALLPPAPPPPAPDAPTPGAEAPAPAEPAPSAQAEPESTLHIHVASYRSVEAAERGWKELQSAHPDLLGDLSLDISKVDLGPGQGIFFRVRAGPIESVEAAKSLCAELRARDVYCVPTI